MRALSVTFVLAGLVACGNVAREEGENAQGGGRASTMGASGMSTAGASNSLAAGAAGSSSGQVAVADCARYCESVRPFRLPGALCEDWNQPGWHPEFCYLTGQAESCADYCGLVYQNVTPACAAVLPAVIRCVAPIYANLTVLPAGQCWLSQCRPELIKMTSVCYGLPGQLAAARTTWAQSRRVDYELDYISETGTEARVTVRAGSVTEVTPASAFAWTVPLLFDAVESELGSPDVVPTVSYDPTFGYVTSLGLLQGCEERPILRVVTLSPLDAD